MEEYEHIAQVRKQNRLTQKELSEKTGLSLRTIQRIENGKVKPRPFTLNKIEEALGIEVKTPTLGTTSKAWENSYLKLIFFCSLFLPVLYSILAFLYWKNHKWELDHQRLAIKRIVDINLITACLLIPVMVFILMLLLRSLQVPVQLKFIPTFIPVYGLLATINLLWTYKNLQQLERIHRN